MPVFDITQEPILPTFFIAHIYIYIYIYIYTNIVQVNRSPGGRELSPFLYPGREISIGMAQEVGNGNK